jgi:hypothetical protein
MWRLSKLTLLSLEKNKRLITMTRRQSRNWVYGSFIPDFYEQSGKDWWKVDKKYTDDDGLAALLPFSSDFTGQLFVSLRQIGSTAASEEPIEDAEGGNAIRGSKAEGSQDDWRERAAGAEALGSLRAETAEETYSRSQRIWARVEGELQGRGCGWGLEERSARGDAREDIEDIWDDARGVEGDLRKRERSMAESKPPEIVEMLEADERGVSCCRVISSHDRGSQFESNLYWRGESDEADHLSHLVSRRPSRGSPEEGRGLHRWGGTLIAEERSSLQQIEVRAVRRGRYSEGGVQCEGSDGGGLWVWLNLLEDLQSRFTSAAAGHLPPSGDIGERKTGRGPWHWTVRHGRRLGWLSLLWTRWVSRLVWKMTRLWQQFRWQQGGGIRRKEICDELQHHRLAESLDAFLLCSHRLCRQDRLFLPLPVFIFVSHHSSPLREDSDLLLVNNFKSISQIGMVWLL